MAQEYHHTIEITWGCGCKVLNALQLADGLEPNAETVVGALIETIFDDDVALMLTHDHELGGSEKLDIAVRTKVGPIEG